MAGLIKTAATRGGLADSVSVCVITGNGLKDPDTAERFEPVSFDVPARLDAIEAALGF